MFAKVTFGAALMVVLAACSNSTVPEQPATTTTQASATTTQVSTTTTEVSSTTTQVSTTTTLDTNGDVQALDPVGTILPNQRLSLGDYTTTVMTPTIRFSTERFWNFRGEFPSLMLLAPSSGQQELNFVLFPSYSGENVVETIKNEPIFEASEVVPATVGGIDGVSFVVDVVVPGGGSAQTTIFPNNQTLSQVDLEPPTFRDGDLIRFTVVEVEGNVLVILAGSGPSGFDDFLDTADELLATVTFG